MSKQRRYSTPARQFNWFLQDSAPFHANKSTRAFLIRENIPHLPWPGNSPDLNPIENLWKQMKKKVDEREPSSLVDLKNNILAVWVFGTSPETCDTLARPGPCQGGKQQSFPISTEGHLYELVRATGLKSSLCIHCKLTILKYWLLIYGFMEIYGNLWLFYIRGC